jgi:hypothetical protein
MRARRRLAGDAGSAPAAARRVAFTVLAVAVVGVACSSESVIEPSRGPQQVASSSLNPSEPTVDPTAAGTPRPATEQPSAAPMTRVDGTWSHIASAPVAGRSGRSAIWTGREVIVWGGGLAGGAAFDPETGRWRKLRIGPIAPRTDPVATWTGNEVLVWGGAAGKPATDGAAYDPATDRWRLMAATRDLDGAPPVGVWSGRELIVVTGTRRTAAYDPRTDTWRGLPPPRLPDGLMQAVSAGRQMIVLGLGDAGLEPVHAAALDPAAGNWRALPDAPLSGIDSGEASVAAGDRVVMATAVFAPELDRWQLAAGCQGWTTTTAVWTGRVVLTPTLALDPYAGRCLPVAPPPTNLEAIAHRESPSVAWTGDSMVLWSGTSGEEVVAANDGVLLTPSRP